MSNCFACIIFITYYVIVKKYNIRTVSLILMAHTFETEVHAKDYAIYSEISNSINLDDDYRTNERKDSVHSEAIIKFNKKSKRPKKYYNRKKQKRKYEKSEKRDILGNFMSIENFNPYFDLPGPFHMGFTQPPPIFQIPYGYSHMLQPQLTMQPQPSMQPQPTMQPQPKMQPQASLSPHSHAPLLVCALSKLLNVTNGMCPSHATHANTNIITSPKTTSITKSIKPIDTMPEFPMKIILTSEKFTKPKNNTIESLIQNNAISENESSSLNYNNNSMKSKHITKIETSTESVILKILLNVTKFGDEIKNALNTMKEPKYFAKKEDNLSTKSVSKSDFNLSTYSRYLYTILLEVRNVTNSTDAYSTKTIDENLVEPDISKESPESSGGASLEHLVNKLSKHIMKKIGFLLFTVASNT